MAAAIRWRKPEGTVEAMMYRTVPFGHRNTEDPAKVVILAFQRLRLGRTGGRYRRRAADAH